MLHIPLFDPSYKNQNETDEKTEKEIKKRNELKHSRDLLGRIVTYMKGSGIQVMPFVKFCQYSLFSYTAVAISPILFNIANV